MSDKVEYSEGIYGDGAAILKDGVRMTIDEIVYELKSLQINSHIHQQVEKAMVEIHKLISNLPEYKILVECPECGGLGIKDCDTCSENSQGFDIYGVIKLCSLNCIKCPSCKGTGKITKAIEVGLIGEVVEG